VSVSVSVSVSAIQTIARARDVRFEFSWARGESQLL
jgi:hypothetical protein